MQADNERATDQETIRNGCGVDRFAPANATANDYDHLHQRIADLEAQRAATNEQWQAIQATAAEARRVNDALRRTTGRLARAQDLRAFLGELLTESLCLLGAARGHVFTYDPDDATFTYAAGAVCGRYYLEPEADEPALFRRAFPASTYPVFPRLVADRQPMLLSRDGGDFPAPPQVQAWLHAQGMTDAVCLALLAGDDPVGFFGLMFRATSALTPGHLDLFQALANHAALAIRMARLAEGARLAAVAEERNRLARDIHDTVGQGLAGISVHLETAKRAAPRDPAKAIACVEEALTLARLGLSEVRRSVWELRPLDLDGGELPEALRRLAARADQSAGARVLLRVVGSAAPLSPRIEAELLRIAQEAIGNSLRHAQPTAVEVTLDYQRGIRLEVADNGRGFDPVVVADGRGFGLVSMRERATRVGAEVIIESQPGHGTRVAVVLPGEAGAEAR